MGLGAHENDSPVSIQENLLLLANTYMQSNQAYRAFNLLSGNPLLISAPGA